MVAFNGTMFTYRDFVDELRPRIEQARSLKDCQGLDQNPDFRRWRHEVTDLVRRIEGYGYRVNCGIQARPFSYRYGAPAGIDRVKFNLDLDDTITELSTITAQFDRYGDPKPSKAQSSANTPLKMPDKVTAAWIWHPVKFLGYSRSPRSYMAIRRSDLALPCQLAKPEADRFLDNPVTGTGTVWFGYNLFPDFQPSSSPV